MRADQIPILGIRSLKGTKTSKGSPEIGLPEVRTTKMVCHAI